MSDKTSVIRGPKVTYNKTRAWARTQTTGTLVATLPKGARLLGFILGGTASDAGTSATISIGNTTTATEYVNGYDIKTAANGAGPTMLPMVAGKFGSVLTTDTPIYFIYAETGTPSTAGGGYVDIRFTTGELINDATL